MKKIAILLLGSAMLSGCGSEDGSNSQPSHMKSSVVEGVIEHVDVPNNEVTLNGNAYNITKITFSDDQELQLSDIQPNMMVRLTTQSDDRVSSVSAELTLEPTMVGVITNVHHVSGDFKINGVALSADKALLTGIDNGDWVMISSLPTANAGYHVLSIVKFESGDHGYVEMEGMLNHLEAHQFILGSNLIVNYENAQIEDNARLSNGQWVEVMGTMDGSVFNAQSIEVEEYNDLDQNTDIEGVITWVENDKSSFELNYKGRFVVTNNTVYEDNGSKELLAIGKQVEVTAKQVNGKNQVIEIEFEGLDDDWIGSDELELTGMIVSTDFDVSESDSFVIKTLQGNKTIFITQRTEFDDHLTLNNLYVGMLVEVETYLVNGQYMAIEIEQESDND